MSINQLDVKSTLFEHFKQRNPVDPGRLHHHGVNLTLPQPRGQGVEVGSKRPKLLHRLRIPICGHGDPMLGRPYINPSSIEVQLLSPVLGCTRLGAAPAVVGHRLDDVLQVPSLRPPSCTIPSGIGCGGRTKGILPNGSPRALGVYHH